MHFTYYVSLIPCLFPLCRHTHELKLHQLLVRVCGWEQIKPVSVDKVGVFFRYAAADRTNSSNTVSTSKTKLFFITQFPKKLTNCVKLKAATRNFYFLLILAFVLITMKYKCNIFSMLFLYIDVYRIELIM